MTSITVYAPPHTARKTVRSSINAPATTDDLRGVTGTGDTGPWARAIVAAIPLPVPPLGDIGLALRPGGEAA